MSPSRFHEPPIAVAGSSQMVCANPPVVLTRFSTPPASKAMKRPSDDQKNGGALAAVSEPATGWMSRESMARIQSRTIPSVPVPRNAS